MLMCCARTLFYWSLVCTWKLPLMFPVTSQLNHSSQFTMKFINRITYIVVMRVVTYEQKKVQTTQKHACTSKTYCTCLRGHFYLQFFHCLLHFIYHWKANIIHHRIQSTYISNRTNGDWTQHNNAIQTVEINAV